MADVKGDIAGIADPGKDSEDMQKRIWFDWGEKELYTKTSKPLVEKLYPHAHIIVREGYEHCEYMMKENYDYVRSLQKIIEG